jgi:hypothetical protein
MTITKTSKDHICRPTYLPWTSPLNIYSRGPILKAANWGLYLRFPVPYKFLPSQHQFWWWFCVCTRHHSHLQLWVKALYAGWYGVAQDENIKNWTNHCIPRNCLAINVIIVNYHLYIHTILDYVKISIEWPLGSLKRLCKVLLYLGKICGKFWVVLWMGYLVYYVHLVGPTSTHRHKFSASAYSPYTSDRVSSF